MKILTLILVSASALLAQVTQAQQLRNELVQGEGQNQTLVTIQKDLKVIAQDEELSTLNVMYVSSDKNCRVESKSQELKAGEKYRLGYIYHSQSGAQMTINLISVDGAKEASIECLSMSDESGLNIYNSTLGEALLMK